MINTTYTNFRKELSSYMDKVNDDHTPLLITRSNGNPAVLMSLDDFHSYEETQYLSKSDANAERLKESVEELRYSDKLLRVGVYVHPSEERIEVSQYRHDLNDVIHVKTKDMVDSVEFCRSVGSRTDNGIGGVGYSELKFSPPYRSNYFYAIRESILNWMYFNNYFWITGDNSSYPKKEINL